MVFARRLLGLGVVSLLAACSASQDKDIPPAVGVPTTPGTSTPSVPGDSGTTGDADAGPAPTIDAAVDGGSACLAQANFGLDGAYGGVLAIRGTVSLPAPLPQTRAVSITFQAAVGGEARQQTYFALATSDRFTFRVGGLIPGRYIMRVQADATNNGAVTDVGDYDGFFDGTAAGPILQRADAVSIEVKDVCRDGVDFGAGVKP